jgi:hypothetical protein
MKTTLTDGSPVTDNHREINPDTGQQRGYVVLSEDERKRGYVEPLRYSYIHEKCRTVTSMSHSIAETYAINPIGFYSGTFCSNCRNHFPIGEEGEFIWNDGNNQKVGTIAL